MDEETERRLIEAAQAGDRDAFNQLLTCYRQMVYEYCISWIGDHCKADEATQNALFYAWQHLANFRYQPGGFKRWLVACARRRSKEIERGYDSLAEQTLREREVVERGFRVMTVDDLAETLGTELPLDYFADLSPRQREILALKADGYRTGEIAAYLGITSGAVRMALQRARNKLSALTNEDAE